MRLDEKLAKIELLLLDVDGILTDGKIRYDENGIETKAFSVTDGHGLKMLSRIGIDVGIVTGRKSPVVDKRASELGITEVHQGALNKLEVVREILIRRKLSPEKVCYMGDDIVDLPVLLQVGLSVSVADAEEDVKKRVDWVISKNGGAGAVRTLTDALIKAKGRWDELTDKYFNPESL
jgi:3-deoxy-D-manno-octulosonate 8-phosphate phosphatase (KDO 8-P phosphatase)